MSKTFVTYHLTLQQCDLYLPYKIMSRTTPIAVVQHQQVCSLIYLLNLEIEMANKTIFFF